MSIIINVIKILFLLDFLILIHEGGHFFVARLCGVKVKEFSLGFGPLIFSKKGKETVYSIRAILFGGYVSMLGENEAINEKGSFTNAHVLKRIAIVLAGAVVNIVFAVILYFSIMCIYSVNVSNVVENVTDSYQIVQKDIYLGDKILEINGKKIRVKSDIDNVMYTLDNDELEILVERNGQNINIATTPILYEYNGYSRYLLGVELKKADSSFYNNIYYGFWETVSFLDSMKYSMILLFTGNVSMDQMSGPVGISEMVVKTDGLYEFLYLLAIVSLSLGITNLLPIPALDGGKALFLLIEHITRKKVNEKIELEIQTIGFSFLMILAIYISFNDILKLF